MTGGRGRGGTQESILRPLFWIIAYDDILQLQSLPGGVHPVAHTSGLALTKKTAMEIELDVNKAVQAIQEWTAAAGLSMVLEKG